MPTNVELLTAWRDTDRERDWEIWEGRLEELLSRLPVPTMLRLARDEVARGLPAFERHHPHMRWPRIWLEALKSGEPFTFDESTDEVWEEAPGPGGNNFTESVRQLALAPAASGVQRIKHTKSAIMGAIMAETTEIGGSKYRDLWDLWFQDVSNHDEEHKYYWVLSKIHADPDAAAAEAAAWNRLADELTAALGAAGTATSTADKDAVPTETELFARLRYAATYRDWNVAREVLEALLARLPVPTMLRLAQSEVRQRLPLFERHHPHIRWPRVWLDALESGEPFTFDPSTPEVSEQAPGPGGNNFTEAVRLLALATAAEGSQRIKLTVEAIAWALIVDGLELGGSKDRESWDRWFQDMKNIEWQRMYPRVMRDMDRDPDVAAADRAAWNRLADALAAALGVSG